MQSKNTQTLELRYPVQQERTASPMLSGYGKLKYNEAYFSDPNILNAYFTKDGNIFSSSSFIVSSHDGGRTIYSEEEKLAIMQWGHDYMAKNMKDLDPEISDLINDNFFDLI